MDNNKVSKDKRKEEAKEIQQIEYRMYENKFPNIDDLVMCLITSTFEDGAYVELLEYNKIKGMIYSSEMTRKRVKYVKKIVKEGREEVLRVLRVDTNQGYIDLSKKAVKSEEIEDFKDHYLKSKTVHGIMKLLSFKTKIDLDKIYPMLCWPLYKTHPHAYDAFKEILNDEEAVFSKLQVDEIVRKELIEILKLKMVPQPVKIRADFKLTCFKFEGIDAIKSALLEGEKLSTQEIPIKFRVIGSPIYECTTTTINKAEGIKLIGNALKAVEASIRLREGNFLLQTKPQVIGDTTEKTLHQQLEDKVKEIREDSDEEQVEQEEGIIANIEGIDDEDLTKLSKSKKKRNDSEDEEEDDDEEN